jgi:peptidoglycan biosynthesis protein MviN/MurJ (putative lipid II flippase)
LAAFSVKLLANLITVHALKEIGLALSTSISYLIMFSLSCLFLRKMSILKKLLPLAVELLVICINILFSLLLTYAFWAFQLEWRFHFLSLLIFPAIYVINSLVLKQEIVRLIISRFRSMVSEQKVSVEN